MDYIVIVPDRFEPALDALLDEARTFDPALTKAGLVGKLVLDPVAARANVLVRVRVEDYSNRLSQLSDADRAEVEALIDTKEGK